ncbi:putative enzyme related to lactoylglutathione lyase [Pedobacter sp. AK013]|uniref:VOC family protein n=1 Tax=Pedobacter sp. AK013 TaxID=2723071 RepID=UPI00160BDF61|nr:VOC family protein [Pedobacter sp. AK013]MBB6236257.1 putative enzyme related to lactoylglutathione lyase [Pedobacter sp. AK013]
MKLSRIILFGNDISALKVFYQSIFNFSLIEEIENEWLVFNAGVIEIAFHRIGDSFRNEDSFHAESNVKLVFSIEEDIEEVRKKLIERGAKMKDIKSFEGIDFLFCDGEDIEGNVFQLSRKKA